MRPSSEPKMDFVMWVKSLEFILCKIGTLGLKCSDVVRVFHIALLLSAGLRNCQLSILTLAEAFLSLDLLLCLR